MTGNSFHARVYLLRPDLGCEFVLFLLICIQSVARAIDGSTICNRIPGLVPEQRKLCRGYPDAMATIGDGVSLALKECQHQFQDSRWNCSSAPNENIPPLLFMSSVGEFHRYI